MACPECERRRKMLRDAVLHGKMADAMEITVEGLRTMIGIDASADHRAAPKGFATGGVISSEPRAIPVVGEGGAEAVVPRRSRSCKAK